MAKSYLYVLGVIAVTLGVSTAVTDDEVEAVRTAIRPFLDACGEEYGITRDQLLAAKKAGTVGSLDPCFHECFFKKIGFINDKGHFDADVAVEKNKKYFKGEDDIVKIESVAKTCSAVNDETISDEEKSCDRSKLLVNCLTKEKSTFSPFGAP